MAKLRCLESRLHVRIAGETERRSGDSNKVRRSRAVWIMTGDTSADRNRPVSLRADETLFVVALKAERLGGVGEGCVAAVRRDIVANLALSILDGRMQYLTFQYQQVTL